MNRDPELRTIGWLLCWTILWVGLALWYHRRWLEALTERSDALTQATLLLAARIDPAGAAAAGYERAETAPPETPETPETPEMPVTVSFPPPVEKASGSGAAADGPVT